MTTEPKNLPWHHGGVSLLALAFYGLGALKYLAIKLGLFPSAFPPEVLALVQGFPLWLDVLWALCIWGGLLGAWLLYAGGRAAPLLLFGAVIAFALLSVWCLLFTTPTLFGIYGLDALYMVIGVGVVMAAFWLYARWERSEKLLQA